MSKYKSLYFENMYRSKFSIRVARTNKDLYTSTIYKKITLTLIINCYMWTTYKIKYVVA